MQKMAQNGISDARVFADRYNMLGGELGLEGQDLRRVVPLAALEMAPLSYDLDADVAPTKEQHEDLMKRGLGAL
jgi:hypothetical protein